MVPPVAPSLVVLIGVGVLTGVITGGGWLTVVGVVVAAAVGHTASGIMVNEPAGPLPPPDHWGW